jgi:hypothetical protein
MTETTPSGPLSEDPQFRTLWAPDEYPATTDGAVRLRQVLRRRTVMGYLWAAVDDSAAGFVVRAHAGDAGHNAAVAWVERLRWAKAQGLSPLQALRSWEDRGEDPDAGRVDSTEYQAASLDELERAAG